METTNQLTNDNALQILKHFYQMEVFLLEQEQWQASDRQTPPPLPPSEKIRTDWQAYAQNKELYFLDLVYDAGGKNG